MRVAVRHALDKTAGKAPHYRRPVRHSQVPMALVSLIDADSLFFKSFAGGEAGTHGQAELVQGCTISALPPHS